MDKLLEIKNSVKNNFLLYLIAYLIAFFIYAFVDSLYQLVIGLKIDAFFYKRQGIQDIYNTKPQYLYLILVFFILIAYANLVLSILPAIKKKNIFIALHNGFTLGIVAYATFAFPLAWSIKNYPIALAFIHVFTGGLFSLITSGLTTWIYLKKNK